MARRRNSQFARRMADLGYTLEGLADEVNRVVTATDPPRAQASKRWVIHLLNGETLWPRTHYRTALEQIFGCTALELGFRPPLGHTSNPIPAQAEHTPDPEPGEADMDRRRFISLISVGAATITLPDLDTSARIGYSDVQRLRSPLTELRALDQKHGAAGLSDAAAQVGATITELLRNATMSDRVRRAVYALHGEYMTAAAWFALDSNDPGLCGRHLNHALTDAALAQDPLLQACIWNIMAYRASETGHWTEVLAISRAAMAGTGARREPRIAALMHAKAARGYAAQGNHRMSSRSIGRAHEALDKQVGQPGAPWLGFVDRAELDAFASNAARQLGDFHRADKLAQQAVLATPSPMSRNRLSRSLMSVQARLGATEIEGAVHAAEEPLTAIHGLKSARLLRKMHTIRDDLSRWADVPQARDWVERYDQATST